MAEMVADKSENMVNYHACALAELLRKKMVEKLPTMVNLKKEYKSYCECLNFWSDTAKDANDVISNIENDGQVFLGALNYVAEKLSQFKDNSFNSESECSKTSRSTTFNNPEIKAIKTTEIKEKNKNHRTQKKTEDVSCKAKSVDGDDTNRANIRKFELEISELTGSNNELKNRNRILLNDFNALEKKFDEERKRRKSIESRCENGKCQKADYQNLKNENFIVKHKMKVLEEENEMMKAQSEKCLLLEQMQAKVKTQRASLANLNQAYKKLLDKVMSNESISRNQTDSGINRKRWLNDKYEDKNGTESKRQKTKIVAAEFGLEDNIDKSQPEVKPKKIKSLFDIGDSSVEKSVHHENKLKSMELDKFKIVLDTVQPMENQVEIETKPKIKNFSSVQGNKTNVGQLIKKEENIRTPFESMENLIDQNILLKVKIETEPDEKVLD